MAVKQAKISELIPDDQNFNTGTEFGNSLIEKSLSTFGAGRSILLDKNNRVIAGNKTLESAAEINLEDVLIVETTGDQIVAVKRTDIDLDSKKGREMALADNATAKANISFDFGKIAEWEVPAAEWGIEIPEFSLAIQEEDEEQAAEAISKAKELQEKWQTKEGQLWQLGEHRLLCGDSTKKEDVEKLMQEEKAALCLTDPPYGINQDKGFVGAGGFAGKGSPIPRRSYNDDWDKERPSPEVFALLFEFSESAIIFGGNFFADLLPQSKHWLVWDKLNTMPTFGDCELAWTNIGRNSVKKYTVEYNGLIGKERERFHPTQKPTRLMSAILSDYAPNGGLTYDPFCGSGTTLIACEQLNRKCRAIEIAPEYVAVTLERWAILTGKEPQLES